MSQHLPERLRRTPLLAETLAGQLRRAINRGRYKPADKLPTERELSETHGVSRAIVREALGRLKQDGLIVSRQGSGVFVAERSTPVFRLEPVDMLDAGEVRNVIELLSAVEAAAAGIAAQRRTPIQLKAIEARFDDIGRAITEGALGVEEDISFHRAIIDATGNPVFRDMFDFLDNRTRMFICAARSNTSRFAGLPMQVQEEHRAILDAIAAQDQARASLAAAEHLQNALERLSLRA